MQQVRGRTSKWPARVRKIVFILALLILIGGATIWALNSLNSPPALFTTIFGALATIFSFIQLIPIIFDKKSHDLALPGPPSVPSDPLNLRAQPLPIDPYSIQQREPIVKDIYAQLIAPGTCAVVLTGIGGIGKSTLAALVLNYAERERRAMGWSIRWKKLAQLVLNYAERERRAGKGPFRSEPILLRINENTQFLELAANIFAAVGVSMPDLTSAPPQNQAFAVVNALNTANTADTPRLIVLDQFENLLDLQSGQALPTRVGVGEFLDTLNSQPCACRVLLTSRPRPHGTRDDPSAALHIYPVGGLETLEGIALLRTLGINSTEGELREAVERCDGHAQSLTLLGTLLQTYAVSLAVLLGDPAYTQLWEGRIAQNLLDRIFNNLPDPSRQLLCAYSVYREVVPIDAILAIVAPTTKAQVLTTLGSLLEQHLVEPQTTPEYYRLHPIVATYARNHFVVNDEVANKQGRQAANAKAAQYYLQMHCPARDKRRQISDVQPLVEAVWQQCQAGQFQEAYELIGREALFSSLELWGANTTLLELCQLLLSENWQFTPQQKVGIYSYIASTSSVLGQKQVALQYYQEALQINREVGDRGDEGRMLNNLGTVYDSLGRKQEALKYYQEALQIRREVGDRGGEGRTLNNLGLVYKELGRKQEALKYYQEALQIAREVGDRGVEGTTLNNLGTVYDDLGQKQRALEYYQEALQIRREVGDRGGEGTTLNNLGKVYSDLGQKQQALQYFLEALQIAREVGDRGDEGTALNNLGGVYNDLDQQQEALQYFQQALQITREVGDRGGEGSTLNNLGGVYNDLDQKQKALQYFLEALQIARVVGDRGVEGITLNNLGGVYSDLGQKREALQYFLEALQITKEVGDRGGEGRMLNNLGTVYDSLGRKQEALKYYQEALQIRRKVGDRGGEGLTLHNIGTIYFSQGRDEVALACVLLAKEFFERVQSPSDVDDEVQWIAGLRQRIGEEQFTALLVQVEPRAEQIVEEALRKELGEQ